MVIFQDDIPEQCDMIVSICRSNGFNLDYTIKSFTEIDRFIDSYSSKGHSNHGDLLSKDLGLKLCAFGFYIGETLIRTSMGGSWLIDNLDSQGELSAAVVLSNGVTCWPIQRVLKRYYNGSEDAIYQYGLAIVDQ